VIRQIVGILLLVGGLEATGFPSSYYEISDNKAQRQAFGRIMRPMIEKANATILQERAFVQSFFSRYLPQFFRDIPSEDLRKLTQIREKYRIESLYDHRAYERRVDVIPASLALTQAAIESGWGKSRFVREANNIFGHWTWGEVGLIPENREEGKTHRIRIFKSLQDSVDAYVLNLNRHYAYKLFRDAREEARLNNERFNGLKAAQTMLYYSELREKYVEMLVKVIEENNFILYDNTGFRDQPLLSPPLGNELRLGQ
jgi:Bax protein